MNPESRPISFTLIVDNFGVKYVQEDVGHLIASTKSTDNLTEDWTDSLYCGITLDCWDCVKHTVDILMPGYIKKKLQEYNHFLPKKVQMCPYLSEPKRFSTEAQAPLPPNSLPKLDVKGIKRVQQIVGSILYYARAVDMTILMALSLIAVEQAKAMEKTMS